MHAARDAPAGRAVAAGIADVRPGSGRPERQFRGCARATAAVRLPTPCRAGEDQARRHRAARGRRAPAAPAVADGRRSCGRASRVEGSYHPSTGSWQPTSSLPLSLLLLPVFFFSRRPSSSVFFAAPEQLRPEAALLLRLFLGLFAVSVSGGRRVDGPAGLGEPPWCPAGGSGVPTPTSPAGIGGGRRRVPKLPASGRMKPLPRGAGTCRRLRALDEVVGVDHRPALEQPVLGRAYRDVAAARRSAASPTRGTRSRRRHSPGARTSPACRPWSRPS